MKLLLDTHTWIWSLIAHEKLVKRVRTMLNAGDNSIWLSPVSIWEALVLAERGRIRLDTEPRRWIAEAIERTPAEEAPLNFQIAIRSREILGAHADPADRFLVATALVYDLTLVTADQVLIDAKICKILKST